MAKRVLSISRIRSLASTGMRGDRPSELITGKSPAGSTGRLNFERPAATCSRGSSPDRVRETSAPSGSLRTISYRVWAGAVIWPGTSTWAAPPSTISMSRSVAEKPTRSRSAVSSTFDRIGMVLRRSTTLCTWPRAFSSAARSIVSFMSRPKSGRSQANRRGPRRFACQGTMDISGNAAPRKGVGRRILPCKAGEDVQVRPWCPPSRPRSRACRRRGSGPGPRRPPPERPWRPPRPSPGAQPGRTARSRPAAS